MAVSFVKSRTLSQTSPTKTSGSLSSLSITTSSKLSLKTRRSLAVVPQNHHRRNVHRQQSCKWTIWRRSWWQNRWSQQRQQKRWKERRSSLRNFRKRRSRRKTDCAKNVSSRFRPSVNLKVRFRYWNWECKNIMQKLWRRGKKSAQHLPKCHRTKRSYRPKAQNLKIWSSGRRSERIKCVKIRIFIKRKLYKGGELMRTKSLTKSKTEKKTHLNGKKN